MPNASPFVLPQYQGSLYDLQRQQALAQALMQQSMSPQQNTNPVGSGQYSVTPKFSPLGGAAQLGQAYLAAKVGQQAGQGMNQLGQQQWSSLIGALGGGAAGQSPQPSPGSANGGVGVANPFDGADGGDGTPTTPASGAVNGSASGAQLANNVGRSPLNPLGMNPQMAAMMMMQEPSEYWKSQASAYKQADIVPQLRAAGIDPNSDQGHALARALIDKNNYVAPVSGTGILRNPYTMQPVAANPDMPAGTTPLFDASGNVAAVRPIQGAQAAMQGNAAANAAGGAQFKPVQVYNPQTQQMEYSNEAQVTNPGVPAPVRNNNPGALMPGGKMAQYPDMQTGLAALDKNLQSYGGQGINTVSAAITKWAPPKDANGNVINDTAAYIKDVSQRLGIGPDQKIDLSNPLQRQALSTAIALHENGPQGVFGAGQQQSGRFAASAPMGAQANAESVAKGAVDTMQKSYQNLQTVRSGAPAALQDVDNMSKLAAGASPLTLGASGAKFAGLFSANAAEYEKSRDNLVTNLGSQLGINSDAARDLVYGSIPSYGAPKQAVQNGLDTLRGQIQTRLIKSDYLSDAYSSGDAKAYNQKENQFDQNMTPKIATIVSLPSGPARAAALQAAIKDPQIKAKLEWAASNGVLK